MSFETLEPRVRRAIKDSLVSAGLPGFGDDESRIVIRRNPEASGLTAPAIVLSPVRNERRRSAAGMRQRVINTMVSFYFRCDEEDQRDSEKQSYCTETVAAMFDLPPSLPANLSGHVPEVVESRVSPADKFLPPAYRYQVDVHRMVIGIEVCQLAGVAT